MIFAFFRGYFGWFVNRTEAQKRKAAFDLVRTRCQQQALANIRRSFGQ